jgi:CBS domain-containing protein
MKLKKLFRKLNRIHRNVRVRDIMTKKIISADLNEPVYKALKKMGKHDISTIITSKDNKPVGIFTERDVIKRLMLKDHDPKKTKLKQVMTPNPKIVNPDDSVLKASNIMKGKHVRKLIVVDNDEIVGIISQTDIINSFNEIYRSYKALLWNPWLFVLLFIFTLILYLINLLIFK